MIIMTVNATVKHKSGAEAKTCCQYFKKEEIKMRKEVIASGKGIDAALENAKAALGAGPLDDVQYEILEMGSNGIFGIIGVKPTKIKAYMEVPDKEPVGHKNFRDSRPSEEEIQKAIAEEQKKKAQNAKKNENKEEEKEERENEDAEVTLTKVDAEAGEDCSLDFVNTLIGNLGINAFATLYKCSNGTRRIVIDGEDAGTLIGHHGETLDSIQYLSNLACIKKNSKGERDKSRVTIDIEGYRSKREETLRAIARKMAAKALRNNRSVVLEPMNADERRIIHSEVHNIEGVTTNSIGSDNNRKVVIYIQKNKETVSDLSSDNSDGNE